MALECLIGFFNSLLGAEHVGPAESEFRWYKRTLRGLMKWGLPPWSPAFGVPLQLIIQDSGINVVLDEFLDKPFTVGPAKLVIISAVEKEV